MKKLNIDARSVATYSSITVVGLLLLFLATPLIGQTQLYGYILFAGLLWLAPFVLTGVVLIYLMGKSKRSVKTISRNFNKYAAGIVLGSIVLSVISLLISTREPVYTAGTWRYVLANTSVFLLYAAFAITLLLINNQRFVYWPFWNRTDKLKADERQKAVRQRVFEKAYRFNLLLLLASLILNNVYDQRIHDHLILATILCLLGMPALIAAWQKDS